MLCIYGCDVEGLSENNVNLLFLLFPLLLAGGKPAGETI